MSRDDAGGQPDDYGVLVEEQYKKGMLERAEPGTSIYSVGIVDVPTCYLPHSCDEWFIGNEDAARALRDDLQAFIDYCQEKK